MNAQDISHLATLSRLELTQEETQEFSQKIDSIVGFIDQIKAVSLPEEAVRDMALSNRFRSDERVHEAGESADLIRENFPQKTDRQLVVKKVLPN